MSAVQEATKAPARAGESRHWKPLALAGLHLFVLSAFALAQPLFDLLGRSPEFFVVRGSTRWDIVAFALLLLVAPPALLLAIEALARLAGERAFVAVHLVFVAALTALVALQALKRLSDGRSALLVVLAALVGLAAAIGYARVGALRSILSVLVPAPLVFAGLFLLNSPVTKITLAETEEARAAAAERTTTPIVWVVFDELPTSSLMRPDGRVDRGRYPNFAALADDSTWFRSATTVHEHSTEAVPAIFTGEYPERGNLPFLADHPESIFTLLGDDYGFDVFESITHLCPADRCPRGRESFARRMESLNADLGVVYLHLLLPEDMTSSLPDVTQTWANFGGGDDGDAAETERKRFKEGIDHIVGAELEKDQSLFFEAFVSAIEADDKPTLYLVHVMLPHSPWVYLPSGARYSNRGGIDGLTIDTWWDDEWLVEQGFQRHLLQTEYTDRLLGRLLDRLRATGIYDRSLVVVVADHGVSFRPGDHRRMPTETNLHDVAFVPLFVKRPNQREGRVVDEHVQTVDILPSVADAAGLELPWPTDGRSFFDRGFRGEPTVEVELRNVDRVVRGDFEALLRRRDETLARQIALFGSGRSGPGLFGIAPGATDLLGRRVDSVRVAGGARARAQLDDVGLLANVGAGAVRIPARLTGSVAGADGPLELALAVNGRIEAVTRTFEENGSVRFSALVPESAVRDGANGVSVLTVSGSPGARVLTRIGGT